MRPQITKTNKVYVQKRNIKNSVITMCKTILFIKTISQESYRLPFLKNREKREKDLLKTYLTIAALLKKVTYYLHLLNLLKESTYLKFYWPGKKPR